MGTVTDSRTRALLQYMKFINGKCQSEIKKLSAGGVFSFCLHTVILNWEISSRQFNTVTAV